MYRKAEAHTPNRDSADESQWKNVAGVPLLMDCRQGRVRLVPSLSGIKFIKVFKLRRITPAFRQKGWAIWTPFTLVGSWEFGLSEIVESLCKACTTSRSPRLSCMHSCPRSGPLPLVSAPDCNGVVRVVLGTSISTSPVYACLVQRVSQRAFAGEQTDCTRSHI